ncbi:MCP four helix bundle domain-containing protein, partial [Pseudomonas viridiflava]
MLRQLKIAVRTAVCFTLMVVLVIGLGVFSLQQLRSIREQSLEIENDSLPGIALGDDIALAFEKTRTTAMKLLSTHTDQQVEQVHAELLEKKAGFQKAIQAYTPLITSEDERALINQLGAGYQSYAEGAERVYQLVKDNQVDAGQKLAWVEMKTIADSMEALVGKLEKLNDASEEESSASATSVYGSAFSITLAVMLLAVLLTVLLAWRLSRSLSVPISQALLTSETIASGDLRPTGVDRAGSDEAALLLQSMEQMRLSLSKTLTHVGDAANQLASATEEMNALIVDSNNDLVAQNS